MDAFLKRGAGGPAQKKQKANDKLLRPETNKVYGKPINKDSNGEYEHGWQTAITIAFFTENEEEPNQITCNVKTQSGKACGKKVNIKGCSGICNGFHHACNNHFGKRIDDIVAAYNTAIEEGCAEGGLFHLVADNTTDKEKAMADWIELIAMGNLPISAVTNELFRKFCKNDHIFGVAMTRETFFQLMILVQKRISDDMKKAKGGALMHDGWTYVRMHFLGVLVTYMKEQKVFEKDKWIFEMVIQSALLTVSPMLESSDDIDGDVEHLEKRGYVFLVGRMF